MARNSPGGFSTVAVATVVAASLLFAVPSLLGTVGKLLLGVPLLLVFPGYVVVRLLFGTSSSWMADQQQKRSGTEHRNGLVTLAIAVGFSVIIVPILIRGMMFVTAYSRTAVIFTVSAFILTVAVVGAYREATTSNLATSERPPRSIPDRVRGYFDRDAKFGLVTSIILIASVIFFLSTVGFALSGEPAGESYTEFYLVTENESGDLVAEGYPTTLDGIESTELVAGIENNEHQEVTYSIVVDVQRLANESVVEEQEVLRTQRTVDAGESTRLRHTIETDISASNARIQYYLYRGEAPADPSVEGAYRTVHLSIDETG